MMRIVLSALIASLLTLTGCSSLTHPTASQTIVDKTLSALAQVKSCQLDTDFIGEFGLTEWKGTKVINVSDKEMVMNMVITMGPSPFISVSDEMYFMNGQEYWDTISEANIPQTIGWEKTQLNNADWNQQTQISFLTELLKTATQFSSLETEQLNNIDYYVLTITPSAQASVDWVFSQGQPGGPSFTDGVGHTLVRTDTYNGGSVELWINQNSYLPVKVEVNIDFHGSVLTGVVTAPPYTPNYESGTVDWSFQGQLDFSNYNQPVSIQVPQDALNAQEVGN